MDNATEAKLGVRVIKGTDDRPLRHRNTVVDNATKAKPGARVIKGGEDRSLRRRVTIAMGLGLMAMVGAVM